MTYTVYPVLIIQQFRTKSKMWKDSTRCSKAIAEQENFSGIFPEIFRKNSEILLFRKSYNPTPERSKPGARYDRHCFSESCLSESRLSESPLSESRLSEAASVIIFTSNRFRFRSQIIWYSLNYLWWIRSSIHCTTFNTSIGTWCRFCWTFDSYPDQIGTWSTVDRTHFHSTYEREQQMLWEIRINKNSWFRFDLYHNSRRKMWTHLSSQILFIR